MKRANISMLPDNAMQQGGERHSVAALQQMNINQGSEAGPSAVLSGKYITQFSFQLYSTPQCENAAI